MLGVPPVGCCPLSVEESCGGEGEGARADRDDTGSVGSRLAKRFAYCGRRIIEWAESRHNDGVSCGQRRESLYGVNGVPRSGGDHSRRSRADAKGIPFPFILVAKHLGGNGKVKGD
ncbi:MAG: hypothetical protein JWO49_2701 [Arthrobacter sp.]|nr:hypothetical protein [Arthrobacter sp.]